MAKAFKFGFDFKVSGERAAAERVHADLQDYIEKKFNPGPDVGLQVIASKIKPARLKPLPPLKV